MSSSTEPLPFEPPPTASSDPRYEEHRAMLRESQRNFEYYVAHEAEIFECHSDDIAVIYDSGSVHYCADEDAVVGFLDTLTERQRSAALPCTALLSQGAWALCVACFAASSAHRYMPTRSFNSHPLAAP